MRYCVKVSNGDYSPSYPYKGKDKDIAIAVVTAYIAAGKRAAIIEVDDSAKEGK